MVVKPLKRQQPRTVANSNAPMYRSRIVLTIKLQLSREYNSAVVFFGKGKPEYVVVSFHDVLLCTLAFPLIFNLRDNVF